MSALPQKVDLLRWVAGQRQLDSVSKYILEKLAGFADAECCAWAKVETLAEAVNVSDRTIQTRLRKLEADGLIERTERTHRLKGSTRSVPIYQLAPEEAGLGLKVSMGENPAPIGSHGCKSDGGMGEAVFTPKEPTGTEGESYDSPMRERARERAAFGDLEAAYPRGGLKVTDREAAWQELCILADQGVEIEQLAACARAMAVDPVIKRRDYGPPSMQAWLSRGQYRGWWPEAPAAAAEAATPAGALPEELAEAFGPTFIQTWAQGAIWNAEDRVLVTRLGVQAAKFRSDKADVLAAQAVTVLSRAEADAQHHEGVA